MVITKIKVFPIGVKLKKPLRIAKMIRERSSNIVVKIETDEGIEGYGEATSVHFFWGEIWESGTGFQFGKAVHK